MTVFCGIARFKEYGKNKHKEATFYEGDKRF